MNKIIDDVILKCLTCGANLVQYHDCKVGMCSKKIYYCCDNCNGWIARKDIFSNYLLNVFYEKNEKGE